METEKIVEAIRKATNGTFLPERHSSTLLGWTKVYDEEGREVSVDPNTKEGRIQIMDKSYLITRHGWKVWIWKPEWKENSNPWDKHEREKYCLAELNLKPDYVKDYEERKAAKFLQFKKDIIEKGELICYLGSDDNFSYELRGYQGAVAFVIFYRVEYGNSDRTWDGVAHINIMQDFQCRFMLDGVKKQLEHEQ